MLDRLNYIAPTPVTSTGKILTGQAIAKSDWSLRERAWLAAQWKLGLIQVDPGTKLAADVFGVCVQLVRGMVKELQPTGIEAAIKTPTFLDLTWDNASDTERDDFVKRHLLSVWDAVDRVTV